MITTLCYLEKDNRYLMLHRTKKEKDINAGKWLGVGGKLEEGESVEECLVREIREETGLIADSYEKRGIVTFLYNEDEPLYMHLFTCKEFHGNLIENCSEGDLAWIEKEKVLDLNLWEGDRIFLELLPKETPFFELILEYQGDSLIDSRLSFLELD